MLNSDGVDCENKDNACQTINESPHYLMFS